MSETTTAPAAEQSSVAEGTASKSFIEASVSKADETPTPAQEAETAEVTAEDTAQDNPQPEQEAQADSDDREEQPATGEEQGLLDAKRAETTKRQEAEAEAASLRTEVAELRGMVQQLTTQAQTQPPQPPRPDSQQDPRGFQQRWQRDLNDSKFRAVEQHGALAVQEAEATFNVHFNSGRISEALKNEIRRSPDPVSFVMDWYNGLKAENQRAQIDQRLAQHGGDLDALIEAEVAKRLAGTQLGTSAAQSALKPLSPPIVNGRGGGRNNGREPAPQSQFMKQTLANRG